MVPESTAEPLTGPVLLHAGAATSRSGLGQRQSRHYIGHRHGNIWARRWLPGVLQSCECGSKHHGKCSVAVRSVTRFSSRRRTPVSTWVWSMTATTTCWPFGTGRRSPRLQRSRWVSLSQIPVQALWGIFWVLTAVCGSDRPPMRLFWRWTFTPPIQTPSSPAESRTSSSGPGTETPLSGSRGSLGWVTSLCFHGNDV